MTSEAPGLLVIGAGPGVSGSVARRFAREGHDVALLGRDDDAMAGVAADVRGLGRAVHTRVADLTDVDAATRAVTELAEVLARVDVLHFNPSAFRQANPLELSAAALLEDVALGVGALLTAVQAARPWLAAGARITVTGSMAADKPSPGAASLGVQKAGVQNLVRSLDRTLKPEGVRAVSVTVRGSLAKEGPFTPDRVADAIFDASRQPEDDWRAEVPYAPEG